MLEGMHTVEVLEEAIRVARRMGYAIREEPLAGAGGGACEIRGRKWLFLDLDLGPREQLEQVLDALRLDCRTFVAPVPTPLRAALERKATQVN
jgi:hypothetical protein